MTYVLHYAPDNASLIIRLALDHANVPFKTALVNRRANDLESPAYRKLNPVGLIPVLETPAGPIFETGAILAWLSEHHEGFGPAPGSIKRADFLRWLFFTSNTLHPLMRLMFYAGKYIGPDPALQHSLREGISGQICAALKNLDQMAASKPDWLNKSALPFYIAACLRWCALYPKNFDKAWFRLTDTPHLAELCVQIETLPAIQKLHQAEGLGLRPFTVPEPIRPPQGNPT